ncbi:CsbD family protein [Arthrobacter sp. ISL-65]|nr:CsbD family protein [Arthrobacter sp. ISL-65]
MGIGDKIKHAAEEARGKIKTKTGEATGNDRLKAEGTVEQADAKLKTAGDKAKDAEKDAKDKLDGT